MAATRFVIWVLVQSICAKAERIEDTLVEDVYDDDYDDDDNDHRSSTGSNMHEATELTERADWGFIKRAANNIIRRRRRRRAPPKRGFHFSKALSFFTCGARRSTSLAQLQEQRQLATRRVSATISANSRDATVRYDSGKLFARKSVLTSSGTVNFRFKLTVTIKRNWIYQKTYKYIIWAPSPATFMIGLWATAGIEFRVTLNGQITLQLDYPVTWNFCFKWARKCNRNGAYIKFGQLRKTWYSSVYLSGSAGLRLGIALDKGTIITTAISVTARLTLTGWTVGFKLEWHIKLKGLTTWIHIANLLGRALQFLTGNAYCHKGFGDLKIADLAHGTIYSTSLNTQRRRR